MGSGKRIDIAITDPFLIEIFSDAKKKNGINHKDLVKTWFESYQSNGVDQHLYALENWALRSSFNPHLPRMIHLIGNFLRNQILIESEKRTELICIELEDILRKHLREQREILDNMTIGVIAKATGGSKQ